MLPQVSANRLAAHDEEELPATQGGSAAAGGSATAAEAAARARGKLVSALMKRHLVEQVVPVLVELRRLLAEVGCSTCRICGRLMCTAWTNQP